MKRQWNYVATLGAVVTLGYLGALGYGLGAGSLKITEFATYALPVVTPWFSLMGSIIKDD